MKVRTATLAFRAGFLVALSTVILSGTFLAVFYAGAHLARAYSDLTEDIHRAKECVGDGWCDAAHQQLYVVREDANQSANVSVDYYGHTGDPFTYWINGTNIHNASADALRNFIIQKCVTYFASCPDTYYADWLSNRTQLTVHLNLSVPMASMELMRVVRPCSVGLDGVDWSEWYWKPATNSTIVLEIPGGEHTLTFRGCGIVASDVIVFFLVALFLMIAMLYALYFRNQFFLFTLGASWFIYGVWLGSSGVYYLIVLAFIAFGAVVMIAAMRMRRTWTYRVR